MRAHSLVLLSCSLLVPFACDGSVGGGGLGGGGMGGMGGEATASSGGKSGTGGKSATGGRSGSGTGGDTVTAGAPPFGGDPSGSTGGTTSTGSASASGGAGAGTGGRPGNLTCTTDVEGAEALQQGRGKCYIGFPQSADWSGARQFCQDLGGDLAAVGTERIRNIILSSDFAQTASIYYVGASDLDTEGTWTWTTGAPFGDGVLWLDGQPDSGATENCGEFYMPGTGYVGLNDVSCDFERPFICEFEDGPLP